MIRMEAIEMDPLQRQMLDDVFDAFQMISGGAIVSLMHAEGGFTRWSPSAVELFDLPGEYVPNGAMDWAEYVHPEDRKRYLDAMAPLSSGDLHAYDLTYRVRLKTGEYSNFRVIGSVLRNGAGDPSLIGGVMINQGLTENTDPITVLPNKYALYENLNGIMSEERNAVVLLLGVSKLSKINEEHGYSYGNRVLQEIAWLAQETVGERGKVFRMDAATFAVVTERCSREEVAAIYDSIRLKLQRGIRIEGNRHNLTANGGMLSMHGLRMEPATVYSCLSYAYHESKCYHHGELVDFNGGTKYDSNEELERINAIRDCILEDCRGFSLKYQPIFRAKTGAAVGVEALVRWTGEPFGTVEPEAFIPVLEKDYVFEELAEWILRHAMADGVKFLERNPEFILGINISPNQMEDEYFIDSVTAAMAETGFPSKNLCVDLTKNCRLLDIERVSAAVDALHKRGIRVILDDFGAGFESLGFLKKLSADYIKFDCKLIRGVGESEADGAMIRCLAECAAARGTHVIAKGVDRAETRDILMKYPIDSIQGDLYAEPIGSDEVIQNYL